MLRTYEKRMRKLKQTFDFQVNICHARTMQILRKCNIITFQRLANNLKKVKVNDNLYKNFGFFLTMCLFMKPLKL